ncbi:hypothetical protein HYDPIDRAFT_167258 [Hydnomerulius pinastri MD-312]|nr:hypothetical protein HYDPIDRAFT_167258 [Hydnomerulius pinastri MD-312]
MAGSCGGDKFDRSLREWRRCTVSRSGHCRTAESTTFLIDARVRAFVSKHGNNQRADKRTAHTRPCLRIQRLEAAWFGYVPYMSTVGVLDKAALQGPAQEEILIARRPETQQSSDKACWHIIDESNQSVQFSRRVPNKSLKAIHLMQNYAIRIRAS